MKKSLLVGYLLVFIAEGPVALARMQTQPAPGGTTPAPTIEQAPPAGQQPAAPPAGSAPPAGTPPPANPPAAAPPAGAPPAPGPGAATAPPSGGPPPAPVNPNVSPPVVLPPPSTAGNGSTGITATPSLRRRTGDVVRSSVRRPGAPATRPLTGAAPRPPGARGPAAQATPAPVVTGNTDIGSSAAGASSSVVVQNAGEAGGLPGEREFNQCKKLPAGRRILKFNFKPDSEISDLVGWISTISCTQFLIAGPTLQGKKVTVLSPQLITPEEAYRLFLGALESVGLTVEPMGKFLRIVETGRARFSNLPVYKDGEPMYGDKRYVTRLFRFDHLESTDVLTNLYNQVRGEQGVGVAYQGSLIVTDQAVMIQRFEQLVRELDVPSGSKEKIWMVRVKNTSATEMASRLAEIFAVQQMGSGGRRPGAPGAPAGAPPPAQGQARAVVSKKPDLNAQLTITKLIPDERSNQLIVVASEQAYEWLLTIMKKLDVPIEGGGDGRFHIYYCEHANCDELASTLAAVTGVAVVGGVGATRRTARTSVPGQPAPAPAPVAPTTGPGQQQQLPQLFEGDVRVTFDAATNSLVVYSSLKDYQSLRRVIDKLDLPRKQVYVEAMIMEVLLDKTRTMGVSYHGGYPIKGVSFPGTEGDAVAIGGFNPGKTLSPTSLVGDLTGLAGALFGPALSATATRIFGTNVDIPSFGAFIKILQENNDVNVLSTPHLLITNNQEGEISVGSRLPFPGALLGGLGGLGGAQQAGLGFLPQVSVNREDVSLRMKLIPSVNEHNMIRLDVDVEISDLMSANFGGLGPATTKRTAKTPVFCKDQQTVVIGGLMSDRTTDTVQKVPILGDIPVLGFFFRSTTKQMVKSNIIIALTPYVIDDMDDLRRVADKKMRERREFIERYSSADDKARLEANIDYRRKRGMLEEINRSAREIDDEESALRRIRERDLIDESTPIELPNQAPAPRPRAGQEPEPARPARPASSNSDREQSKPERQGMLPPATRPVAVKQER
jgi:general secretion pathway protein D